MIGTTNAVENVNFKKSINYIEYIESSGTQYIDTGVIPTSKTKWVYDYQFLSDKNYANEESAQNGCGIANNTKRFVIGYGGGQLNTNIGINASTTLAGDTNRHTFILDAVNKAGFIDDFKISCEYTSFSGSDTICFFTRNEGGSKNKFLHKGRIYASQIYENGVLVRDFRPALDENGVACLYDKVENKYYYNAGSGDLIIG